jgi:hypothetical protein
MILDNLTLLSGSQLAGSTSYTPQTVTGASAVLSTNSLDQGAVRDLGMGATTNLFFQVGTAFAGLTSLLIEAIEADDAALTVNPTTVGSSGPLAVAALTANARFFIEINPRIASRGQRYLGVRYTPTGTGTAGSMLCTIGADQDDPLKKNLFASGVSVI